MTSTYRGVNLVLSLMLVLGLVWAPSPLMTVAPWPPWALFATALALGAMLPVTALAHRAVPVVHAVIVGEIAADLMFAVWEPGVARPLDALLFVALVLGVAVLATVCAWRLARSRVTASTPRA